MSKKWHSILYLSNNFSFSAPSSMCHPPIKYNGNDCLLSIHQFEKEETFFISLCRMHAHAHHITIMLISDKIYIFGIGCRWCNWKAPLTALNEIEIVESSSCPGFNNSRLQAIITQYALDPIKNHCSDQPVFKLCYVVPYELLSNMHPEN